MATTMALSDLMIAVRQRADATTTGYTPSLTGTQFFVTDPELISFINQSCFELYDVLIKVFGANYYISAPYVFSTDGVTQFFTLPADFYKLVGISVISPTAVQNVYPIKPGSFREMQQLVGTYPSSPFYVNSKYMLTGSNLWIAPLMTSGQQVQMFYVPRFTQLVALTDTLDGISGWTEYVIVDAAIKYKEKEESDVSILGAQKAGLLKRIEDSASTRDAANSSRIIDVNECVTPYGWTSGGFGI
jgi:hypothetical protein